MAGNIGADAATGRASTEGELLLTGGIAGFMSSGEAIMGATIGPDAAAGILLGNSTAGQNISGVAGGAV